jgi:hypothetical protein
LSASAAQRVLDGTQVSAILREAGQRGGGGEDEDGDEDEDGGSFG